MKPATLAFVIGAVGGYLGGLLLGHSHQPDAQKEEPKRSTSHKRQAGSLAKPRLDPKLEEGKVQVMVITTTRDTPLAVRLPAPASASTDPQPRCPSLQVLDLPLCRVYLMNDSNYPCWLVLVPLVAGDVREVGQTRLVLRAPWTRSRMSGQPAQSTVVLV
jgi:hypothetical protein